MGTKWPRLRGRTWLAVDPWEEWRVQCCFARKLRAEAVTSCVSRWQDAPTSERRSDTSSAVHTSFKDSPTRFPPWPKRLNVRIHRKKMILNCRIKLSVDWMTCLYARAEWLISVCYINLGDIFIQKRSTPIILTMTARVVAAMISVTRLRMTLQTRVIGSGSQSISITPIYLYASKGVN